MTEHQEGVIDAAVDGEFSLAVAVRVNVECASNDPRRFVVYGQLRVGRGELLLAP